jgi:hypothetical protein
MEFPLEDVLDDPDSTFFPLGMSLVMTGIFQSSCHFFISHSISSALMQNQSCSHSLSGSMRACIHILFCVTLKLSIPWYYATTLGTIDLQVLAIFSCRSMKYQAKVMALPLLHFGSEVFPNYVYHAVRHHPTLSNKYE